MRPLSTPLTCGGFFRLKPGQRWFPIAGEEYFTVARPGFVWNARVRLAPLVWVEACDSLLAGKGNMLVRLLSTFPIADERGEHIDQGSQARWLAELVWIPVGFAGGCIRWEAMGQYEARATLLAGGLPVSVIVEIGHEGKLVCVRGERYRDTGGGQAVLTPWIARCGDYRDFDGLRVPASVEVGWNLDEGEFIYARFRVTALEYNVNSRAPDGILKRGARS